VTNETFLEPFVQCGAEQQWDNPASSNASCAIDVEKLMLLSTVYRDAWAPWMHEMQESQFKTALLPFAHTGCGITFKDPMPVSER
jgi:hypothetical protein